ncbi:Bax inhibitor-1/YccA family protein [Asticcacaulis sp. W401b]|uniref:Bax inhibitor-1/YccA family protein n=1 Tax=Asticcacaulis sp. W401b TaxID=3388666 RepID=UPI003970B39E
MQPRGHSRDLFSGSGATTRTLSMDGDLRRYMMGIYNRMGLALLISGGVAFLAAQSPGFINAVYVMSGDRISGLTGLGWGLAFAPLVMAMVLGFGVMRMSLATAQFSFWVFAAIMGLSLTSIVLAYTGASIAQAFLITAITFGLTSFWGYTTKQDLTRFGGFLMMAVIGLIVASLVNLLLQSSWLQLALSALGVLIFTALTAYDTQRLKGLYCDLSDQGETRGKIMILGALSLYINVINIFTSLLHLTGERR